MHSRRRQILDCGVFLRNRSCFGVGIRVAAQFGVMRKTAIVIVVASLFASTAAISVKHQRRWTEKLDVGLVPAAQQSNTESVKVLIRVRPGSTDRIIAHLAQHGLKPERALVAEAVAVQMPASMMRALAGDADVVHLSQNSASATVERQ